MDTFKTLTDMRKSLPLYFANVMSAKCFRLIRLKRKIHCTHLAKERKKEHLMSMKPVRLIPNREVSRHFISLAH